MDVSDRIRSLIKEKGFTQKAFAEKVGLSQSFISALSSNRKSPNLETLELICDALGISLSDFFRPFDTSKVEIDPFIEVLIWKASALSKDQISLLTNIASQFYIPAEQPSADIKTAFLPLLGAAAAGPPLNSTAFPDESVLVPAKYADSSQFYAITVIGDSMSPRINHGDIAVVRYDSIPSINDIVLVRCDGIGEDDYSIKILKSLGKNVVLQSINPSHSPLIVPIQNVHSLEKVMHIVHT